MAMAAESSSARSNSAADSYLGSLISLTSKSEIRYEGVLYNINTEESSIGLRHVRSFGTEGRKKDGPQVPPSEKVYDYILFRGSDIKDLQVKSSPPAPAQPTPSINNDPAIIQSHYPRQVPTSTALPSTTSVPTADVSHTAQMGQPAPNFQSGLPLYQPGGNMGPWGASPLPPTANPGGGQMAMPMYWQGYYGAPSGMPQMQQQPLLRPPTGLLIPPLQQQIQHPNFNATLPTGALNLPETSNTLLTMGSTLHPVASATLPSTTQPPAPLPTLPSEILSGSLAISKAPMFATPSTTADTTLTVGTTKENNPMLPLEPASQSALLGGTLNSVLTENLAPTPTPSLVTPNQLLQQGPTNILSSQSSQVAQKDVEVVRVSSPPPLEPSATVTGEAQPPILHLPPPARTGYDAQNGPRFQNHYGHRGRERGRGRGSWSSRPVTNYSEDFDFMAMNEKFNKDEVWGHLGKNSRNHSRDEADANLADEEDFYDEDENESSKSEVKPVYNKDDFFDSLSCDSLRIRFSEQRKVDTETFGDFSRYGGGRGGRYGGNFRGRGSYNSRGYGYNRRGRGRTIYTSAS